MNSWFQDEKEYREHFEMLSSPRLWPKGLTEMCHVKNPSKFDDPDSQDTAFGIVTYEDNQLTLWRGHKGTREEIKYESVEGVDERRLGRGLGET